MIHRRIRFVPSTSSDRVRAYRSALDVEHHFNGLVTGSEADQVVEDHDLHGHVVFHPVPHDPGAGRVQHGQPVERALGPHLLDHADRGVRQDDAHEQPVLPLPGDEDQHEQRGEQSVEDGEDVRPHDLRAELLSPP